MTETAPDSHRLIIPETTLGELATPVKKVRKGWIVIGHSYVRGVGRELHVESGRLVVGPVELARPRAGGGPAAPAV
jgi:hypothetical protein